MTAKPRRTILAAGLALSLSSVAAHSASLTYRGTLQDGGKAAERFAQGCRFEDRDVIRAHDRTCSRRAGRRPNAGRMKRGHLRLARPRSPNLLQHLRAR